MAREKPLRPFKLPFKAQSPRGTKNIPEKKKLPCLKIVIFIVDWHKAQDISDIFENEKVRFHFITKGMGTANSEVLDLMGIGSSDKAVVVCVEQEVLIPVLFTEVKKKLGFYSPGAGIGFSIPISGINTPLLKVFKESIHKNEKLAAGREGEAMTKEEALSEIRNDLIVAIINIGYSDDFMNTARDAGATGGTVMHARGLAHQGPVKFFGVSVQDEKEIVLILAAREKKLQIMEAVSLAHGIASKAEGLIFSLPVDCVIGLNPE